MNIIVYIGKIIFDISKLLERFKMKYILYCLAEHGDNCHLEGKSIITARNIHMGYNVFVGGVQLLFRQEPKFLSAIMLCLVLMFRL